MGSRTIGFGVRRSRSGTTNLGLRSGMTNWCCDCDRDRREGEVERRRRTAKLKGEVERRRQTATAKSGFDLFLGAISLAGAWLAGGVCSLPLSSSSISLSLSSLSLSIFRKIVFEGKIKTEINLHPTHDQLKTISGKCIFLAQPNTRKYGKAFPEVIFTQNKHSLNVQNWFHSWKIVYFEYKEICKFSDTILKNIHNSIHSLNNVYVQCT